MLFDHLKLVVKSASKVFSWKKNYEIVDADSGQALGTAKDTTGLVASLLGGTTIEVRDASNGTPLFTVRRTGLIFKKDEVVDAEGQVVGRFKEKRFSLSGGFHIYDKDGKHLAEFRGKCSRRSTRSSRPTRPGRWGRCRELGAASPSRFSRETIPTACK